jgi:predicted nucleic acid-binding protein
MRSVRRERKAVSVLLLVDSSGWIAAERGDLDLVALAEKYDLAVCPAVVHEVLRGANSSKKYQLARETLLSAYMLDAPVPLDRFEEAAKLYLRCRSVGYAVAGFDCLVAACAIANGVQLAHRDQDFELIAQIAVLPTIRL